MVFSAICSRDGRPQNRAVPPKPGNDLFAPREEAKRTWKVMAFDDVRIAPSMISVGASRRCVPIAGID